LVLHFGEVGLENMCMMVGFEKFVSQPYVEFVVGTQAKLQYFFLTGFFFN